jgi:hypothetical protein
MNEKNTIEFLQNKIKQLELDVQYELHQKEDLLKRYQELELILQLEVAEKEKLKESIK